MIAKILPSYGEKEPKKGKNKLLTKFENINTLWQIGSILLIIAGAIIKHKTIELKLREIWIYLFP